MQYPCGSYLCKLDYLEERKKCVSTRTKCVCVCAHMCVCMNTGIGNRKGRARAVQRVSCEAGSEQGQTTEAMSYGSELLLPKSKINSPLVPHSSL